MKYQYSARLFLLLLFTIAICSGIYAQGDDPCTATPLTVGTTCSSINVSNAGATNSSIPDATCDGGSSAGDIWFTAIVGANGTLTVRTNPGTLTDIGMAIYTGSSCSALTFNSCTAGGNPSFPNMPQKSLTGMPPGSEVWIRLWDVNNDQVGTFNICAFVNCSASVSITGATSGCTAQPTQLCATAGFTSYSWMGGSTNTCINVISTGTYTVTATDADGCTASASQSFTGITSPSVSITGPTDACSADDPMLCVPNIFSNYTWSNGGTTDCISPVATATYSVTVTSSNGCTASTSQHLNVYPSPSISVTGPPSKCSGGPDQLCVPSGYSSYSWSNGGSTDCITPNTTGNYSVQITDGNGCTATAAQSITVRNSPSVSVTGPASACPGTGAQLCVPGGYSSYLWSNTETTNCIFPSSTGLYTVTVTDAFGCTGTSSKTIAIYPAANVSITGPSSACTGSPVQLCTPNGFDSYDWSDGDTTRCTSPLSTGTYTVIVTDANGCTASDNMVFTLKTHPSSAITGPLTTCNGTSAQLCAPAGNASYLWSNSNTSSCITAATSGNYSVTVTGTNGCTSSSSQNLTIFPVFVMNIIGPSTACSGSNPQLCATAGSYTYQWSNGDSTACINPSVSGIYTVVATSVNNCTRSYSKGLTVYSPLNASITGPQSACIGSVIPLCGPAGSSSYTWSTGDTTECINVSSNGNYTVTISDINGCTASASQAEVFDTTFVVNVTGPAYGCFGSSALLCVPSGYSGYLWNTGETTECIDVDTAGNYTVNVLDPVGCSANTSYSISFRTPPSVSITGSAVICNGAFTNWCATPGFPSYLWSNGGTSECINVSIDTVYSVQVTDTDGCKATAASALDVVRIFPLIQDLGPILKCDTFNDAFTYSWLINGSPASCITDTCVPTFPGTYTVIVTDTASGCLESATYNLINVGISNSYIENNIKVYPNPFKGNEFQIDFNNLISGKTSVNVYDAFGSLIYSDEFIISTSHFTRYVSIPERAAGIYYVSIRTKSGVVVRKIVGE